MAKKKNVLYGVAALFAVSGIVALPSGNIAGGVGCIVIAAVCAFLGKKSADKETETGKPAREATRPVSGSRIAETIRTKVVGVTYCNDDGESRQDILSRMTGDEEIQIEKTVYNGEPAAYVKWGDKVLGYLSAELSKDLANRYPNARYEAKLLEISGGGVHTFGCNIELDIIVDEQRGSAQEPAGETVVYVDRSSKKYHIKPDCSGMKNPKAIPLSQAKKKYAPCRKCCK